MIVNQKNMMIPRMIGMMTFNKSNIIHGLKVKHRY